MTGTERACANCDAPLSGPYCTRCGQQDRETEQALGPFLLEFLTGVVSFDSRVWRTVGPLLLKPGGVTAQYLEGRRARYVPPARLYLFVSLLYFLLLAWLSPGPILELGAGVESNGQRVAAEAEELLDRLPDAFAPLVPGLARAAADPAGFRRSVIQGIPYLMFLLVPFFGALVHLLHRGRRRYYLSHLLFAVHFHVVVFLLLIVALVLERTGMTLLDDASALIRLALPVHLFLSLRSVYGGRWWVVAVRTVALSLLYLMALGVVLAWLVVFLLL